MNAGSVMTLECTPPPPRAFWSIFGPRAIMTIALFTLMLPENTVFYINIYPRNALVPHYRIRVAVSRRWRQYFPLPPEPHNLPRRRDSQRLYMRRAAG